MGSSGTVKLISLIGTSGNLVDRIYTKSFSTFKPVPNASRTAELKAHGLGDVFGGLLSLLASWIHLWSLYWEYALAATSRAAVAFEEFRILNDLTLVRVDR